MLFHNGIELKWNRLVTVYSDRDADHERSRGGGSYQHPPTSGPERHNLGRQAEGLVRRFDHRERSQTHSRRCDRGQLIATTGAFR